MFGIRGRVWFRCRRRGQGIIRPPHEFHHLYFKCSWYYCFAMAIRAIGQNIIITLACPIDPQHPTSSQYHCYDSLQNSPTDMAEKTCWDDRYFACPCSAIWCKLLGLSINSSYSHRIFHKHYIISWHHQTSGRYQDLATERVWFLQFRRDGLFRGNASSANCIDFVLPSCTPTKYKPGISAAIYLDSSPMWKWCRLARDIFAYFTSGSLGTTSSATRSRVEHSSNLRIFVEVRVLHQLSYGLRKHSATTSGGRLRLPKLACDFFIYMMFDVIICSPLTYWFLLSSMHFRFWHHGCSASHAMLILIPSHVSGVWPSAIRILSVSQCT